MLTSNTGSHCVYYFPPITGQYSKALFLRVNSNNPYNFIILQHIFQMVYPKMIIAAIKLNLNWLLRNNRIEFDLFCAKSLPGRNSPAKNDEPSFRSLFQ